MRAGKEVTGHTINFSLSDIFSDNLLKNESLRENYYITFFAYEIEEKDKIVITYNKTTDNLPYDKSEFPGYLALDIKAIPDQEFEKLLGRNIKPNIINNY